jgi:HPt (histidine-containing phosphotransfer) domain-containing protein
MSDLKWDKAFALEQAADDEELLQELIDIFKESSLSDLALVKQSIEKGDADMGMSSAHSMKGAAASLGFLGIREVTEVMEADCREGSVAVITAKLPELEQLVSLLQEM